MENIGVTRIGFRNRQKFGTFDKQKIDRIVLSIGRKQNVTHLNSRPLQSQFYQFTTQT